MQQQSRRSLRRTWIYAKPYSGKLAGSMFLALIMIGLGMLQPPIIGRAIDDLGRGDSGRVGLYAAVVVGIGIIEALAAFGRRYIAATSSLSMERDMRNALFEHLQRLPIAFHDGWQSGQLLSRVSGDLGIIRRFVGFAFIFLFVNSIQFIVIAILMFFLNPQLAGFTVLIAVPIAVLGRSLNRRYHVQARAVQDDTGDLATVIEESFTGIRIIKAFGRQKFAISQFRGQADTVHESSMSVARLRATFWPILGYLPALNLAAVVTLGGRSVLQGDMTLGQLNTFILYLIMLGWPLRSVGWILGMAEEARSAADRFFEVMDSPLDIRDADDSAQLPPIRGQLRFENVRFTYPGASGPTLDGVSLRLEPGETMALVGATGSGKTTLASLVPRLLDPDDGRTMIDDIDIKSVTLQSLRTAVGVAFEDPVLFSMSAYENLTLGHQDATNEEINRAIDIAHAGFLRELPWGLDTRVGEQGYSLSGGQRQRLSLARAILGNPSLLVLDDPLSAVDVHTEEQIETALRSVLSEVTALIVVHRPSTIALCDRVALLHEGKIAAVGKHADLMQNNSAYRAVLSTEAPSLGEVTT